MVLLIPPLLGKFGVDAHLAILARLPGNAVEFQILVDRSMSTYGHGSFLEMTQLRLTDFVYRLTAWPYVAGLFTTLSMFCMGAYAGRTDLFRSPYADKFRKLLFVSSGTWAACLGLPYVSSLAPALETPLALKFLTLGTPLIPDGM